MYFGPIVMDRVRPASLLGGALSAVQGAAGIAFAWPAAAFIVPPGGLCRLDWCIGAWLPA